MARISKPMVKQSTETLEHMRMITGKAHFAKTDYEDIAITAAALARQTTNILTRIELHRTAHLSAFAAGMDEMSISEARLARGFMTAFNHGRDLPHAEMAEKDPEIRAFESSLARVARFTPMLSALRTDDNQSADVVAGMTMILSSEHDEKVVPKAVEDLGIAGLFRRGGEDNRLGSRPEL